MVNQERVAVIESRIKNAFQPEFVEVIDESDQHVGHSGHQGGGRHFAVVISAKCLHGMSRVEAHRKVYALFEDLIPNVIHALRIKLI